MLLILIYNLPSKEYVSIETTYYNNLKAIITLKLNLKIKNKKVFETKSIFTKYDIMLWNKMRFQFSEAARMACRHTRVYRRYLFLRLHFHFVGMQPIFWVLVLFEYYVMLVVNCPSHLSLKFLQALQHYPLATSLSNTL